MRSLVTLALALGLTATVGRAQHTARLVRVAVGSAGHQATIAASGSWSLQDAWGRIHARDGVSESWKIERRNRRLRATSPDGTQTTAWSDEPFTLRAGDSASRVGWNGKRFRGALVYLATDSAILVVNHIDLDSYLRGVVPLEIGPRLPNEIAAVEAQAVAARSYTVVRMREANGRDFDLTSSVTDQVYGGVDAERSVSDAGVAATTRLVLTFNGRVVRAPYHSACGGSTAAPSEVWRGGDEAYLQRVSDRIPGSDGTWCESAPRFRLDRSFGRRELEDAVARHVRSTSAATTGGAVRAVRVGEHTRSGRVESLIVESEGGTVKMRGNEMRFGLRAVGGEILNSTYFSLEPVVGRDGRLMQLTLRGMGNGHGVGMCQWGAIGRARAGQDAGEILAAYFPGTVLSRLP